MAPKFQKGPDLKRFMVRSRDRVECGELNVVMVEDVCILRE